MTKDRKEEQKKLLIEQFKKTPVVQVACEKVGVARSTYYRWKKEDSEFFEEAEEALIEGSQLINDMAESQLISAIRDKNLTAIIFWLKNHHNNYRTKVELSGTINTKAMPLNEEEEELIKNALELSSIVEGSQELNNNNK